MTDEIDFLKRPIDYSSFPRNASERIRSAFEGETYNKFNKINRPLKNLIKNYRDLIGYLNSTFGSIEDALQRIVGIGKFKAKAVKTDLENKKLVSLINGCV